ncbi:MAG TPA: AAA family ATPase [Vicinamibacterales bacterium]|jgi:general secretion pathway protein A
MYERFYGLTERPFELTPNPRYLFLTPKHQEALGNVLLGIRQRKGLTLVLGPAGTGKTTLIRAAMANCAGTSANLVSIVNPTMTRAEFVEALAKGFELGEEAGRSKAALLPALERNLRDRLARNLVTALVVDEAQALPDELLEEVRLLVNIETETSKLMPVVLVGQPELADRLNQPFCCALKQRVSLRCELSPLTPSETAQYIATRIRTAGGVPGQLFTREAVDLIHQRSQGTPRVISVICDNALLGGFAASQKPVGRKLVLDVCEDFDLGIAPASASNGSHPPAPPVSATAAAVPVEAVAAPPSAVPAAAAAAAVPVAAAEAPPMVPPTVPVPAAASPPMPELVKATERVEEAPPVLVTEEPQPAVAGRGGNLFGMFGPPARSWFSK